MQLDHIDKKLLNLVQREFPLMPKPFTDLGLPLGIKEEEIIHRLEQLKLKGIIRQISPVIEARKLGYQTTLIAMRVQESQLEKVGGVIGEHPGVSHGYERDHYFNLWFTLAIPPKTDVETELKRLASAINAEAIFDLPATKLFKINVFFDMEEDGHSANSPVSQTDGILPQEAELSSTEKLVINTLQQDLPLIPEPFTALAKPLNIDGENFLTQCHSLLQRGIIRRYGASINHHRAGFQANAMTCWIVPTDKVGVFGQRLAALPEVSHCYERKTNPLWPYNLFAMIHSGNKERCQEIAIRVSLENSLRDYVMLFSTKEFKKARIKYLV